MRLRRDSRLELALGAALVLVTTATPVLTGSAYWLQIFLLVDLYIVAAIGLSVLRGEAGQISFGQGAVFGAGAYATAMAAGLGGVPLVPAMLIGVAAGFAFGLLLALPALRVQSYYLGFVTLAAAVVFPEMLLAHNEVTHAVTGIPVLAPSTAQTLFLGFDWLTLVILVVTLAALATHAVIRSSRFGRQLRVAAHSPEAALTLGISPGAMRLAAFAIAALLTGISGALYAPLFGFVSPGAFPLFLSILLYFSVIVGGVGTLLGPIAGIYLLYIVPNVLLTGLVEYRLIIYGGIAFLAMMFFPDGLIGSIRGRLRRRGARETGRVVTLEPLVADERAGAAGAELTVDGATKRFGEVAALDGASLSVRPFEVHGLVGPNGSGKTTLLNALSGLVRLDAGEVALDGQDITRRTPRQRAALGIGRSFQTPRVFEDMTVWENVDVTESPGDVLARYRTEWDRVPSASLPHAQRRLLEIARVIATTPRVLLLDEPAAGLAPDEREEFGRALRRLAGEGGATVVLVEHDLDLVWQVADTITVMDQGRVIASGDPVEVRASRAVETLFSGGAHAERA